MIIEADLRRARERLAQLAAAPTSPEMWSACSKQSADCTGLEEELAAARGQEEERRLQPVRRTVFWAAVAAVASAVAAIGTWWQATHAPPVRVEVTIPAPVPTAPGPWRPDLFGR